MFLKILIPLIILQCSKKKTAPTTPSSVLSRKGLDLVLQNESTNCTLKVLSVFTGKVFRENIPCEKPETRISNVSPNDIYRVEGMGQVWTEFNGRWEGKLSVGKAYDDQFIFYTANMALDFSESDPCRQAWNQTGPTSSRADVSKIEGRAFGEAFFDFDSYRVFRVRNALPSAALVLNTPEGLISFQDAQRLHTLEPGAAPCLSTLKNRVKIEERWHIAEKGVWLLLTHLNDS